MKRNLFLVLAFFMLSVVTYAQNSVTISGIITDQGREPVIGASIQVKGESQKGTITGVNGDFSLSGVASNATLIISYIGMKDVEVSVNGRTRLNVTMEEDQQTLDEVVVVGYGVQRKSDLTGAVGSIKSAELTRNSTPNVANALQGRVSGVFISANGAPGSSPEVRIRGIGTVNDSNPLYVVDGMFMDDISFLNTHDIESMEVLKDASATAMYGSRGANGVIIVTTKQGSTGKAKVNVSISEGFQFENSDFEMCTAAEYAQLMNEALINTNKQPAYDNPASLGKGTNWFDEIFRTASVRDYQVGVSGGSDKMSYNLSVGYFQQEGIISGNVYDRFTIRANNAYKLNSRLTVGHNLSVSFSNTENENKGVVKSAYTISPIVKPYNEDGTFGDSGISSTHNPVATLHYTNKDDWRERIVGSAYMNLEILKGLNFKSSLGIDYLYKRTRSFTPKYHVSGTQENLHNTLSKDWSRDFTWLWENLLTYDFKINDIHRFNVLGGITAQKRKYELLGGSGTDLFAQTENYWYIDQALEESKKAKNNGYHEAMMSYLFRVNYALMDRYLFTASFRADGSSRFGPDERWGYFPSLAAGWRISEEAFIKDNVSWLSNLKIRGSWGQIGNDKIKNDQYYALANLDKKFNAVFNGQYHSGGTITSLYNTQIHWERSEQLDLGFDLGLFNNRFTLEFDYYKRDTKDMLVTVNVPGSVGLSAVDTNVGSVRNSGLDFTVKWEDNIKDFNYGIRFTGTTIKNEVTNLGGKELTAGDIGAGKLTQLSKEGMPIKYFYGYNVIGIFQSQQQIDEYNAKAAEATGKPAQKYQNNVGPGDLIFEDTDGSGFISADDRKDLGNPTPKFIGGLGLTAAWKGFDLSIDLQGNFGNKIYNAKQAERWSGSDNWDRSYMGRWTEDNPGATIPRMTFEGNNYLVSSRYIESGSYIKLQTVELGYTLPQAWVRKASIQKLRVYFSGNNLAYFTDYNGFTPEILGGLDREIYPITATCRFGLNLTF